MSGWMAGLADVVDAADTGATAPPVTKAATVNSASSSILRQNQRPLYGCMTLDNTSGSNNTTKATFSTASFSTSAGEKPNGEEQFRTNSRQA